MRKAVIRDTDGYVENIIEWEEGTSWQLPDGHYLIDAGDGSPGDTWDGTKFVKPELPISEPPRSTHISTIDAIDTSKARPARIKRAWEGRDYFYDCFVTESVKDQYMAGDIVVGDYVIVHFDDIGEQIVTGKVFKSW